MNKKLISILKLLLNIPNYKLEYIIKYRSYVIGIWNSIRNYGIPYNEENHNIVIDYIQTKLNGPDIEREWSEEEYKSLICYKGEY
jgi:hypothetical protein